MMQTANKRKPATKKSVVAKRSKTKRVRKNNPETDLATLMALLHADRWLFEAAELAKRTEQQQELNEYNRIRAEIVESLNRLQPRAYGAMTRRGYPGIGRF